MSNAPPADDIANATPVPHGPIKTSEVQNTTRLAALPSTGERVSFI